jgi:hypothetical protein
MGNGLPTHGREGVLYLSTSTGSTSFGKVHQQGQLASEQK